LTKVSEARKSRVRANEKRLLYFWKNRVAGDKQHTKELAKAFGRRLNKPLADSTREALYQKNLYNEPNSQTDSPLPTQIIGPGAVPGGYTRKGWNSYEEDNSNYRDIDTTQEHPDRIDHPPYFMVFTGEQGAQKVLTDGYFMTTLRSNII